METVSLQFCEAVASSLSEESLRHLSTVRNFVWRSAAGRVRTKTTYFRISYESSITVNDLCNAKSPRCSEVVISDNSRTVLPERRRLEAFLNVKHMEVLIMRYLTFFDSHLGNFWPDYIVQLVIIGCKFRTNSPFAPWLHRLLGNNILRYISISETSLLEQTTVDLEEALMKAITQGSALSHVHVRNNTNFVNLSAGSVTKVIEFWVNSKEGFKRRVNLYFSDVNATAPCNLHMEYLRSSGRIDHKSSSCYARWSREMGADVVSFMQRRR